jgi:hypothetical protein
MPPKTAKRREGKAWMRRVNTDDDGRGQVPFLAVRFCLAALVALRAWRGSAERSGESTSAGSERMFLAESVDAVPLDEEDLRRGEEKSMWCC